MGNSSYDSDARNVRTVYYASASRADTFTQTREGKIHPEMNPSGVSFRESRDSEIHPFTIPIQLWLDVTGSMGHIPHEMIKTGLPSLMSSLIQNGVKDAALMFGAIGDHEVDKYPLQVGQFESGDDELDLWLTRTFLEGGGGANEGESYLLAWYFAAHHIKTDAFEKRKKKGFVFTVGDEPCLRNLSASALKQIMGSSAVGQGSYSVLELLTMAEAYNHIYHIHISHHGDADSSWKQLLGKRLIVLEDHTQLARIISTTILNHADVVENPIIKSSDNTSSKEENLL